MGDFRICAAAVAVFSLQGLAVVPAQAAGEIGDVVDVLTGAYGQPPELDKRELYRDETVYAEEIVETVPAGGLTVQFHDGSALTLGGDSRVVLDRFVYDPGQNGGAVELGTGVFRFISGELGHGSGFEVRTPTATIGVRGTDFVVVVLPNGETKVGTVSGLVTAARRTGGGGIDLLPGSYAVIRPGEETIELAIAPAPVNDAFALALWLSGDMFVALAGVEPAAGGTPPAAPDCPTGSAYGCGEAPPRGDDENNGPAPATFQPAAGPAEPASGPPGNEPPGNETPGNDPPGNDPPSNDPPSNDSPGNDPPGNDPPGNDPSEDDDSGHGNNPNGADLDNPGQGNGGGNGGGNGNGNGNGNQ